MLKANAYGAGLQPVGRALFAGGVRTFLVARVDEGIHLRQALPNGQILVLEGPTNTNLVAYRQHHLRPVINRLEQLQAWIRNVEASDERLWLHVDTGFNRLGLDSAQWLLCLGELRKFSSLPLGLMTHLACADESEHPLTDLQVSRFGSCHSQLSQAKTSIGNSAGALRGASTCGDLARPGIALFGVNPYVDERHLPLRPALRLEAQVVQIREVPVGETVGYGADWRATRPTRIAVIGAGYGDGIPRDLSRAGWVRSRPGTSQARLNKIVGRISMDLLTVDVTDDPWLKCGDWISLIDDELSVESVARAGGRFTYELMTGLSGRIDRVYAGPSFAINRDDD